MKQTKVSEAASILGKLAAGKPKRYDELEIAKRTARVKDAQRKRAEMLRAASVPPMRLCPKCKCWHGGGQPECYRCENAL